MNFGFSYVGLIFLIMLMLPNIAWTKNQPKDYEKYVVNENKVLLTLERIGEVLVSCAALIFSDFNFRPWSSRSWWLVPMEDFYSSILGIPVAGATLPVLAFLSLAVYGKNIILGVAVLILGIGHIGIHLIHKKEIGR